MFFMKYKLLYTYMSPATCIVRKRTRGTPEAEVWTGVETPQNKIRRNETG
jgi:hypothetical protein